MINTHIHLPPNFSAFASVDEALDQAKAEGCTLLGASNYYDFTIYHTFVEGAKARGIAPTCGIEILCKDEKAETSGERYNDPANPGKVYLCGKALTRWQNPTPRAKQLMSKIRTADAARMDRMARKLHKAFGDGPNADEVILEVANRCQVPPHTVVLQERHLAQAYAEVMGQDAATIRNDWMKKGKPAFVEESFVTVDDGLELIRELGGLPAYPFVVDGMDPVSEKERNLPALMAWMRVKGIGRAEFISARNSPSALEDYVMRLWAGGFSVTCGTEHNTTDPMPIEPRCKGGAPIPSQVLDVFVRSAETLKEHESHA